MAGKACELHVYALGEAYIVHDKLFLIMLTLAKKVYLIFVETRLYSGITLKGVGGSQGVL